MRDISLPLLSPLLQFSLHFLVSPTFSHPSLLSFHIFLPVFHNSAILRSVVKPLLHADNSVPPKIFPETPL